MTKSSIDPSEVRFFSGSSNPQLRCHCEGVLYPKQSPNNLYALVAICQEIWFTILPTLPDKFVKRKE